MRVEAAIIFAAGEQPVRGNGFGHSDHVGAPRQARQKLLHLRFEIKAVPQHEVGTQHKRDVRTGLTVAVRIDARSHQRLDLYAVTAHAARGVRDHAGRGDNPHCAVLSPCVGPHQPEQRKERHSSQKRAARNRRGKGHHQSVNAWTNPRRASARQINTGAPFWLLFWS